DYEASDPCDREFEEVLSFYRNKVRHVVRAFPSGPDGRRAALAARCADAQGKFWPYHQELLHAPDLTAAGLQDLAAAKGLDVGKFKDCLTQRKFDRDVEQDVTDARRAGAKYTRTFFINGNMVSGCWIADRYKQII